MAGWSSFWAQYPAHTAFVVGAYAASAIGVGAVVLDTVLRARRWKAKAAERNAGR